MKFIKQMLLKKIQYILYFFIYYSGLFRLILFFYTVNKKEHKAVILLYHRIVDEHSEEYIFKSGGVHHNLKNFRAELKLLNKWFDVVSLDEIVDRVNTGMSFERPAAVVTFDDGYRDSYTLAYPVMKDLGVPATIYLTTGLTGTNKRTWVDTIEYALLKTKERSVHIPELFGDKKLSITGKKNLEYANAAIGEAMKKVPYREKLRLIVNMYKSLRVDKLPEEENASPRMLNWDEIREMSENGMTFGAHTSNHPVLTKIPIEEAKKEIADSVRMVKEKLGKSRHFAFPNGMHNDFNETLTSYCKEIGVESIVAAEYGVVDKNSNPFYMGRFIPQGPIYIFAVELMRLLILSGKFSSRKEHERK